MFVDQSWIYPIGAITALRGFRLRVLMIQFYFDDSGTHDASPVVLWGGIAGDSENFAYLDAKWREFLKEPSPGRPPIPAFSLSKCKARRGVFEQYDNLAVDAARKRAREIIINSGVSPIAYGIDRSAWDRMVGKHKNKDHGSPDRMAYGLCVNAVLHEANLRGEHVKAHFDRGQDAIVRGVAIEAESIFPELKAVVEYSSLPVASSTGLQAADVIAGEFYEHACKWLLDRDAKPGPELSEIVTRAADARLALMGEEEIAEMIFSLTSAEERSNQEQTEN